MVRYIFVALAVLGAFVLHADSWSLPEEERFHSADGEWRLVVKPKRLHSQLAYFTEKVEADQEGRPIVRDEDHHARATLYRKSRFGRWQRIASWRLVNEVSPVSALVANDGTVVTFDNWHSAGYGDDVIVIYRTDGSLVRQLGLEDLLVPYDISRLRHTVSSIWWSGTHRIDEVQRAVIVQVDAKRLEEFPISLDNGQVLVAKHALFTPPRTTVTWGGNDVSLTKCGDAAPITGSELHEHGAVTTVPEYPEVARKARIAGTVIVEFMIDENGAVTDVVVLKPLPFGLVEATRDAVGRWKFRSFERNGKVVSGCGQATLNFEME
jgi:TonB family protein